MEFGNLEFVSQFPFFRSYQAVDSAAGFAWAFGVTVVLLFFIDKFPGLHLRAPPEHQEIGLDKVDLGVGIYEHLDEHNNNENNGINFINAGKRVSVSPSTPIPISSMQPNIFTVGSNGVINGDVNGQFLQHHQFIKNNGNGFGNVIPANGNVFIVDGAMRAGTSSASGQMQEGEMQMTRVEQPTTSN